jgi:hypothetical protein
MAPKPTRPIQPNPQPKANLTSRKTLKTFRFPGMVPRPPVSPDDEEKSTVWEDLRLPVIRTAMIMGGFAFLVTLWMLVVNGLTSVFNKTSPIVESSSVAPRSSSSPSVSISTPPKPNATSSSAETMGCDGIQTRMSRSKISSQQVNAVFFQKHPERNKKPLTNRPEDQDLQKEWCSIANQLTKSR